MTTVTIETRRSTIRLVANPQLTPPWLQMVSLLENPALSRLA